MVVYLFVVFFLNSLLRVFGWFLKVWVKVLWFFVMKMLSFFICFFFSDGIVFCSILVSVFVSFSILL